jgi:hypothetical protein
MIVRTQFVVTLQADYMTSGLSIGPSVKLYDL